MTPLLKGPSGAIGPRWVRIMIVSALTVVVGTAVTMILTDNPANVRLEGVLIIVAAMLETVLALTYRDGRLKRGLIVAAGFQVMFALVALLAQR
jgi:hypothetical protein